MPGEKKTGQWMEQVKTWLVAANGFVFCLMVHIVLDMPTAMDHPLQWFLYALCTLLQLFLAALLKRIVPMICAAIGMFVLAWYVAQKIAFFNDLGSSEVQALVMMAIMAVQGVVII